MLKPWRKEHWCLPAIDAEYVARMEDVLHLYAQPYDPQYPVVCLDEMPLALVRQVRPVVPAKPGTLQREDYEYARTGSCSVFMLFEPLRGWRHVDVRDQRTGTDMAYCLQTLVNSYPTAQRIRLVTDNLNTHRLSVLYATFAAEEAGRIARKIEWHYTPIHGSWLNQVEGELSVLSRQCLARRLASVVEVDREAAAWESARNAAHVTAHWQFTLHDARHKLGRLYPHPTEILVS